MRYPGYNYSYRMRGEFKVMKMKIRTVNFYHAQLMLFQLASCGNTLRLIRHEAGRLGKLRSSFTTLITVPT